RDRRQFTLFPYATLFRYTPGSGRPSVSLPDRQLRKEKYSELIASAVSLPDRQLRNMPAIGVAIGLLSLPDRQLRKSTAKNSTSRDRKSTRLNSSHVKTSY